jgi:hypothetical protein
MTAYRFRREIEMRWTICCIALLMAAVGAGYLIYDWISDDADRSATVTSGRNLREAPHRDNVEVDHLQTRDQVFASLGQPVMIEADGNKWVYADRVFLFRGQRVIGVVSPDLYDARLGRKDQPTSAEPTIEAPRPSYVRHQVSRNRRSEVIYGEDMSHRNSGPRLFTSRYSTRPYLSRHRDQGNYWNTSRVVYSRRTKK